MTEVEPDTDLLARRIVTFRRVGDMYRRDAEVHRLAFIDPDDVSAELVRSGFEVGRAARYDAVPLPPGVTAFLARKRAAIL